MELSTFLETVTLKQVFDFIVGIVAVVSVIVEFSKKIPFHPWSFVFTQIGKALNKDVRSKLDELEQKCDANNKAIKEVKKDVGDMEQRMTQKLEDSEVNADTKDVAMMAYTSANAIMSWISMLSSTSNVPSFDKPDDGTDPSETGYRGNAPRKHSVIMVERIEDV